MPFASIFDTSLEMFLALVEWLPVTSRSHGRHITDKCKISIMIWGGVLSLITINSVLLPHCI